MPPLPAGAKLLVEFKAGKMIREGKMVKPDDRKGLLRVIKTEDGLTHLEWYQRADGADIPEDDIVIFPEEATFAQVGKPSQRVVQLKFPNEAERNMLFWMQEPSDAKDAELVTRTNRVINEAMGMDIDEWPSAEELRADVLTYAPADNLERANRAGGPGAGFEAIEGDSVGVLPAGPGQELPGGGNMAAQLAQMLSGMAGRGPGAGSGAAAGGNEAGAALMAALLSAVARQQGGPGEAAAVERVAAAALGPGLAELLRPEVMGPLLQDPEMAVRLAQYLPEGQQDAHALSQLAHSPQFQQQLHTFSTALQTGQLDLQQFGLNSQGFSVADFLSAIQDLVDKEQGSGGGQAEGGNKST